MLGVTVGVIGRLGGGCDRNGAVSVVVAYDCVFLFCLSFFFFCTTGALRIRWAADNEIMDNRGVGDEVHR